MEALSDGNYVFLYKLVYIDKTLQEIEPDERIIKCPNRINYKCEHLNNTDKFCWYSKFKTNKHTYIFVYVTNGINQRQPISYRSSCL